MIIVIKYITWLLEFILYDVRNVSNIPSAYKLSMCVLQKEDARFFRKLSGGLFYASKNLSVC